MVHHILTNPIYAGAYVFGRTKTVTRIEQGRKHSIAGQRLPQERWQVVIQEHHESYIVWDEYQSNQRQITHNAAMKGRLVRGPARSGEALLAGLLRCGHCGRKLHVYYTGPKSSCRRYCCQGAMINHGLPDRCISFAGFRADRVIEDELLRRLQPLGIQAALEAIDRRMASNHDQISQKELALEQARFEAARARRQYDAVDPDNRLVVAELEQRWNKSLERYRVLEEELKALHDDRPQAMSESARAVLLQLGDDLPALWGHPQSSAMLKKRIVRTLLHEIIVKQDGHKISMVLHWSGGDHTTLDFLKNKAGQHRHATPDNVVQLIRQLARVQPDQGIVAILNRLGLRTGRGNTWTEGRMRVFRNDHNIAVYEDGERNARGELTLEETAAMLNTSKESVRRLIASKTLNAEQACSGAPWIIQRTEALRIAAKMSLGGPRAKSVDQLSLNIQ